MIQFHVAMKNSALVHVTIHEDKLTNDVLLAAFFLHPIVFMP